LFVLKLSAKKITVWKELEKENKEFFEAYTQSREEKAAAATEMGTRQRIPKMLSDSSKREPND
jgi:hypothetical protein